MICWSNYDPQIRAVGDDSLFLYDGDRIRRKRDKDTTTVLGPRPGHLRVNDVGLICIRIVSYLPEGHLKEYSSLQENPYIVRYIHTVLIIHIYFAPQAVDNV